VDNVVEDVVSHNAGNNESSLGHITIFLSFTGIIEFDPKHCGNYVYLAKWVQNCGKRCRLKGLDGKWLVSVIDMMFIHGGFQSNSKPWDRVKGKIGNSHTMAQTIPPKCEVLRSENLSECLLSTFPIWMWRSKKNPDHRGKF